MYPLKTDDQKPPQMSPITTPTTTPINILNKFEQKFDKQNLQRQVNYPQQRELVIKATTEEINRIQIE